MDKVSRVIRQEHHNQAVSSMPPSLCSLSFFLINRGIGLQFGLVSGQQGSLPWLSAAFSSLWKEYKKGKNLSDAYSLGGESWWKKGERAICYGTWYGGWHQKKRRRIKSFVLYPSVLLNMYYVLMFAWFKKKKSHWINYFWQKHPNTFPISASYLITWSEFEEL